MTLPKIIVIIIEVAVTLVVYKKCKLFNNGCYCYAGIRKCFVLCELKLLLKGRKVGCHFTDTIQIYF